METNVLQVLSDHGINPFAVKLLVESYLRHEKKPKITIPFRGVRITLEMASADYHAWFERSHTVEWLKTLCDAYGLEHDWKNDEDTSATLEMLREVRAIHDQLIRDIGEPPPAPEPVPANPDIPF
jgi:hypothetical protein